MFHSRMRMLRFGLIAVGVALAAPLLAQKPRPVPVELGKVQWQRDFGQALKQSADSGKPLFVQFQEVPG